MKVIFVIVGLFLCIVAGGGTGLLASKFIHNNILQLIFILPVSGILGFVIGQGVMQIYYTLKEWRE